jgi:hypothetical protein
MQLWLPVAIAALGVIWVAGLWAFRKPADAPLSAKDIALVLLFLGGPLLALAWRRYTNRELIFLLIVFLVAALASAILLNGSS